ncbi:MAG: outer membrane beta-barrel family protein [Flavitalea sp.]
MKKIFTGFVRSFAFALLCLLGFQQISFAQSSSLKGTVIDTSEKKNLSNAVVAVLRKSDSVLIRFTRTDKDGKFSITKLPQGAFFMLVTHPNYADYFDNADLDGKSETDKKTVPMITQSQLLEEVVVKQQLGAIRMKKDTTEFIADSFKLAPNATVEDLLRRLPGFQVDKDGKIKAQGEDVPKVLVDGEEFFGNDPTIAIQNIRADNVEKVQLYDKKSDQATFSGIDDGQRTKTVNLKLKEDKKNGYFGKATVGGGLKDKFQNEAMINAFKGKRKLAAFGVMANTGKTGLSWSDQNNYGSQAEMIEMEDGTGYYMRGDDFGGSNFYGEGLPTGWAGGLHYSNKYNEGKNSLNGSYRYNKINNIGGGTTTTQFILPDSTFFQNQRGYNRQSRIRNSANGAYEMQIDSFTSIKVTANGSIGTTENFNANFTESLSEEGIRANLSDRQVVSKTDNQNLVTTALLKKRFKKAGRTLSINFNQTYRKDESDGFLYSDNQYFNSDGSLRSQDSVNQQKQNNNKVSTLAGKAVYTEALTKYFFAEVNYSLASSKSRAERLTLGLLNGKYEDYVDSLSTNYEFNVLTNRGGLSFRYNKKKVNISIGSDISNSNFKQKDLVQDTMITYNYLNLFPRASINYNLGPQRRLSLFYNGNTRQPTIEQLQPLRDNTDPLNVYRGNPDLKQEFRNNYRLSFSDYKLLNGQSTWISLNANTISNAIGNSEYFDTELGKRIYSPMNVNGNYNLNANLGYGFKIPKTELNIYFDGQVGTGKNNSFVNGQTNTTTNTNYGGGIGLSYYKQKKIQISMWSNVSRVISKSSIMESISTKYWQANLNPSFQVFLPKKFEIGTDANIDIREKTALFNTNLNVIKWNAFVGKKFMKDESLILRFEVRDILDQNIGFDRNVSSTNITQRTYDTLRRFWWLSVTYNFSKNGKAPASPWD